jgi:predicted dehydrogenase
MGTKAGAELPPLKIYKDIQGVVADISTGCPELSGHILEIRHFVDCMLQGTKPISTGEQGLEITRILDAIYESAARGKEIILAQHVPQRK